MPLKSYENYRIEIELPPLSGIARKATVDSLPILISGQQIILNVIVSYVDEKGEPMTLPGLTSYTRSLIAGMDTFVNTKTGEPLCDISAEYIDEELNPVLVDVNYDYEFRFMMSLMSVPIILNDMITAKLNFAASVGKLD